MILLSLDPGSHVAGVALWQDGQLFSAAALKNTVEGAGPYECGAMGRLIQSWVEDKVFEFWGTSRVVQIAAEWPRVYSRGSGKSKADPNVNLPLAAVCGAVAALFPSAKMTHYNPSDWKGQVGKPDTVKEPYAIEAKVRARLSPDEIKVLEENWPSSVKQTYDLIDSVGVGLHRLGRFERRRVFARE